MDELEWYLSANGKQSGPHSAKEIVELVRTGKVSPHAQVTSARLNGDWVTASDLVDAYNELYSKAQTPSPPADPDRTTILTGDRGGDDFKPPPRPVEQLEATKTIYLNRPPTERTPDPTDALFQAIQAVREKSQQQKASIASSELLSSASPKTSASSRGPASAVLIVVLAVLFGGAVYGMTLFLKAKGTPQAKSTPVAEQTDSPAPPPPSRVQPPPPSGLLGTGPGAVPSPSRRVEPRNAPGRPPLFRGQGKAPRPESADRLEPGGGARYRDDRDPPLDQDDEDLRDIEDQELLNNPSGFEYPEDRENSEIDEGEFNNPFGRDRADPAPMPLDPSQFPRRENGFDTPFSVPEQDPNADPYDPDFQR